MKDYSFYWEGTSGKGVLLVHGLTGGPAEMQFIGQQLHKRGFTVYAPTLPRHVSKGHCSAQSLRIGWAACENPCIFSGGK